MVLSTAQLPRLDLADHRAGRPGAREMLAAQLRDALVEVGFFSIVGHGIPWEQVEDIYDQAARYHRLPLEEKARHPLGPDRMGYNRLGSERGDDRKPALNAAFFMARPGSARNQWPDDALVPGFRAACATYYAAMDDLCHEWLLPLYATALRLDPAFFQPCFDPSLATLRLSHYPPLAADDDQWGIDPHSDAGFMTLLPANPVAGLQIRRPDGEWVEAAQEPESFVVNSGDMLRRWTNDTFLSTVHRVRNASGTDRYAIPFFYDPRVDTVIECLPTCLAPGETPRHEPIVYRDYLRAFMGRSYRAVRADAGEAAAEGRDATRRGDGPLGHDGPLGGDAHHQEESA